jgi:hypothetical protein
MASNSQEPERPRAEPEILPPDRRGPDQRGWPPNGFGEVHGTHRIYVSRIGPFGFALLMLVVGFLAAVFLLLLIGTALLWIPIMLAVIVIAAISGVWRRL